MLKQEIRNQKLETQNYALLAQDTQSKIQNPKFQFRISNSEPFTKNRQLTTDEWKLVIVGRADHEDRYSIELKEKAVKNSDIILTGFLTGEPLRELYSHAGLFVLPSYYEGLPIVLLEAMSYGLSCIASDIPANRNVELSENRFFKAGDNKALALKIKEFIDKHLTEDEIRRQINMIAKKYNWEKIAEKTLDVYAGI
jgi:glycosyltransferase involved in cell wall biosynthesis